MRLLWVVEFGQFADQPLKLQQAIPQLRLRFALPSAPTRNRFGRSTEELSYLATGELSDFLDAIQAFSNGVRHSG